MRFARTFIGLILGITLLFSGCEKRENTLGRSEIKRGSVSVFQHVFYTELLLQVGNTIQNLKYSVYVPATNDPTQGGNLNNPLPVLILVPPLDADHLFYANHGLREVADELIAQGLIEPMAIVTIDNSSFAGGSFASNRPAAGFLDRILGDSLLVEIFNKYPMFALDGRKPAIGGVGIGAYAAARTAMLNSGEFSSVSLVDGPLDFDGQSNAGGFLSLFSPMLTEQGLWDDPEYLSEIDTGDGQGSWKLSRFILGAAIAFSPLDTAATTFTHIDNNGFLDIDSVCAVRVADSITLCPNVISKTYTQCGGGGEFEFGDFTVPFTRRGNVYAPVWNSFWLPNSANNLLAANPNSLDDVPLWFGTTPKSEYGFYDMTQGFLAALRGAPYNLGNNITEYQYAGYPELPARNSQYLYELLREMLIFHSENF